MKKQGQSCHYEGKSKREIEMKSVDMCNSKKKFAMEKRRRHVNNHKGVKRPKQEPKGVKRPLGSYLFCQSCKN